MANNLKPNVITAKISPTLSVSFKVCPTCRQNEGQDDWPDTHCNTCGAHYEGYGDGFDGECPDCADKTEDMRGHR